VGTLRDVPPGLAQVIMVAFDAETLSIYERLLAALGGGRSRQGK
jgi:hypothetical protein